jgi:hypothetical protein
MTDTHAGLAAFRGQLRDAIERDLAHGLERRARSRRRVRRAGAVGVPAAAAAASALTLLPAGGSPVGSSAADAAILRHTAAALSPPAGTIVHERAMVSLAGGRPQRFELWEETTPPYAYRVVKWGHQGTGTAPHGRPNDPAALFRGLIRSGSARVDAPTTYDGVPAYRLTVHGAADPWVDGVAYVARSTYRPLMIRSHGETITYRVYEYLPATAANQALVR